MDDMTIIDWNPALLDEFKTAAQAAFEDGQDWVEFRGHTYHVHEAWFKAEYLNAHFNACFGTTLQ